MSSWRQGFAAVRRHWGVYVGVVLLATTETGVRFLVGPYLRSTVNMSSVGIGAVVAIVPVAALLARLPSGALFSPARVTRLLVASGALAACCFALLGVTQQPVAIAVLLAGGGLGWSVATTVQLALLVSRPANTGGSFAVMTWFAVTASIGNGAGSALLGALVGPLGYALCFLLIGGILAAGAGLSLRDARRSAVVPAAAAALPSPRRIGAASPWRHLAGYRRLSLLVWASVGLMCYINLIHAVLLTFYPLLALSRGVPLTHAGFALAVVSAASMLTRFLAALDVGGRIGRRLRVPLVIGLAAATVALPGAVGTTKLELPLFAVMGLCRGLLRVIGSADAFDEVQGSQAAVGPTSALLYAGLDAGKIGGPLVGGAVSALIGLPQMLRVVAVVSCLLYLVPRLAVTASHTARASR